MPESSIKVGDLVTVPGTERQWRVTYVDTEREFARLEIQVEAWVRSRIVDLEELRLVTPVPPPPVPPPPVRTASEILDEFSGSSWRP